MKPDHTHDNSAEQGNAPAGPHSMSAPAPHVLSYGRLFAVLCGLFLLTALTVLSARIDVGGLNIWLTLLIAATKSSLVLLFFMHLKFEGRPFRVTFLATLFIVAAFIGLLFWDVAFR